MFNMGKNNKEEEGECRHMNCKHPEMFCPFGGHYTWVRWVLGILILSCVYWFGVQIGSMRSSFENGYGYGPYQMMRQYPSMMQQQRYSQPNGYGMMQWGNNSNYQGTLQQGEVQGAAPQLQQLQDIQPGGAGTRVRGSLPFQQQPQ